MPDGAGDYDDGVSWPAGDTGWYSTVARRVHLAERR
jgi:hypothetical protein